MCLWKYYFHTKETPKTIDTEPVACEEFVYLNLISFSQNFRKKCTCLLELQLLFLVQHVQYQNSKGLLKLWLNMH